MESFEEKNKENDKVPTLAVCATVTVSDVWMVFSSVEDDRIPGILLSSWGVDGDQFSFPTAQVNVLPGLNALKVSSSISVPSTSVYTVTSFSSVIYVIITLMIHLLTEKYNGFTK